MCGTERDNSASATVVRPIGFIWYAWSGFECEVEDSGWVANHCVRIEWEWYRRKAFGQTRLTYVVELNTGRREQPSAVLHACLWMFYLSMAT